MHSHARATHMRTPDGRRSAPPATFFIDESGAKASSGNYFVVAGMKLLEPGRLQRRIEELRDRENYRGEFKFAKISRGQVSVFKRLIDLIVESDARIVGTVVNRSLSTSPFIGSDEEWRVHARLTSQLLAGNISEHQHAAAIVDHRSTKPGVSFGDTIRNMANHRLSNKPVVTVVTVESTANDLLQVADLIAGSIRNHRCNPAPSRISNKTEVANALSTAFGVSTFSRDIREGRINILEKKREAP